jgi:predicted PurR-regulated permease PerM
MRTATASRPRRPFTLAAILTAGALTTFTAWTLVGPLAPVLWSIGLAAFFAIGLSPLVRLLERRMPRSLAIAAVTVGTLVALVGVVLMIVPAVVAQTTQLLTHADQFATSGALDTVAAPIQQFVPVAVLDVRALFDDMLAGLQTGTTFQAVSTGVVGAGAAIANGFFLVTTVLVLTVYFLSSGRWLRGQMVALVPRRVRAISIRVSSRIAFSLSRYFGGQLFLAALNGVLSLVLLLVTGSALPALFAAVAVICALIPLIGIILGAAIIVLSQALFTPENPLPWITLTAWYLVYMMVEAYVIAPRVVGRSVNLRTVVVILVTLVGGFLYGIIGALLAVPVAVAAAAGIRELRDTRQRRASIVREQSDVAADSGPPAGGTDVVIRGTHVAP